MWNSSCGVAEITEGMETREDLKSLLPFLPLVVRSSSLFWPSRVVEALKALSEGPDINNVNSGESLFAAISDIRNSLSLCAEPLAPSAPEGYSLFFDEVTTFSFLCFWVFFPSPRNPDSVTSYSTNWVFFSFLWSLSIPQRFGCWIRTNKQFQGNP